MNECPKCGRPVIEGVVVCDCGHVLKSVFGTEPDRADEPAYRFVGGVSTGHKESAGPRKPPSCPGGRPKAGLESLGALARRILVFWASFATC